MANPGRNEKIGLLGGTFNPIHSGHIKAATVVRDRLGLHKVLLIPSFIPPHKESRDIVSPAHRLKMVELAVKGVPSFVPSSIEIDKKGKSYSILTLRKLKNAFPDSNFFFILGMDAFLEIDTWKEYEKVLDMCFFVVISRKGYHLEEARDVLDGKYAVRTYSLSETEKFQEDLLKRYKIFLLSFDAIDVASTTIRERLRNNQSIKGLVPDAVANFISENQLYQ